jgi:hypothetical protein
MTPQPAPAPTSARPSAALIAYAGGGFFRPTPGNGTGFSSNHQRLPESLGPPRLRQPSSSAPAPAPLLSAGDFPLNGVRPHLKLSVDRDDAVRVRW